MAAAAILAVPGEAAAVMITAATAVQDPSATTIAAVKEPMTMMIVTAVAALAAAAVESNVAGEGIAAPEVFLEGRTVLTASAEEETVAVAGTGTMIETIAAARTVMTTTEADTDMRRRVIPVAAVNMFMNVTRIPVWSLAALKTIIPALVPEMTVAVIMIKSRKRYGDVRIGPF